MAEADLPGSPGRAMLHRTTQRGARQSFHRVPTPSRVVWKMCLTQDEKRDFAAMDVSVDVAEFATMKFGVGQPVPRKEDPTLLQGKGSYTDDQNVAGQVYGVMVRSRIAHGRINGIDTGEAAGMPGVLGIFTGADLLAAGFGMMPKGLTAKNRDGSDMPKPEQPPLTVDKVRFVGDPVAIVVAETAIQAKDAAEAVFLDIDALPAVTDAASAAAPGAPL